jgi:hypothetical protein
VSDLTKGLLASGAGLVLLAAAWLWLSWLLRRDRRAVEEIWRRYERRNEEDRP